MVRRDTLRYSVRGVRDGKAAEVGGLVGGSGSPLHALRWVVAPFGAGGLDVGFDVLSKISKTVLT